MSNDVPTMCSLPFDGRLALEPSLARERILAQGFENIHGDPSNLLAISQLQLQKEAANRLSHHSCSFSAADSTRELEPSSMLVMEAIVADSFAFVLRSSPALPPLPAPLEEHPNSSDLILDHDQPSCTAK